MTDSGHRQPTPFGQYLLLERIGAGGMAEIFRAKTFGAAGFEKEYAIKRILPNLGADEEFVSMFVNEAKLMVDLYHANIVQVFDLGHIDDSYYIAMEFVHGKDLLDLLARCAENDMKIPLKLTLYIMMEMLKGLDFAHKATDRYGDPLNIIHRDVSPSNIMLTYGGDVKIGDFGVAKAKTQTQRTEVGTLKGKVGYMSPEQVRGDEIDHRSDVFAAGIILYETLNMTRLFMGGSDLDVMLKVRDADIDSELSRCKKIPPSMTEILRRALSKNPEDRYQSCEEFYLALRDFVFRHHIKTANRDLSSFLHLVFQDEIEAEKSRHLDDPKQPGEIQIPIMSPPVGSAAPAERPRTAATLPSGRESSDLLDSDKVEFTGERDWSKRLSGVMGYRYRDVTGREYGPMSIGELQGFLSTRPESDHEEVCIGEGPWTSPDDVPQLWGVERPQPDWTEENGRPETLGKQSRRALEMAELEPSHQGRIGRVSLSRLLFRLTRRRCTGMLRVESAVHHKEIFLRRGDPVLVTSSNPDELLGTYLLHRKIITEEQLDRSLERLAEFGGRLGDALVGERIIGTHDLIRYLADQLQDRILDIFTWQNSEWAWIPRSQAPHQAVPLGSDLTEMIVLGIRNKLTADAIRNHFTGRENTHFEVMHSRITVDDLHLLPREIQIANAVTPGKTPKELVELHGKSDPLEQSLVWRVLYFLTEFELYRLAGVVEELPLPG